MVKKLQTIAFTACMGIISTLILCALFLPGLYQRIFPYQFHHVLTNSMEPTIPTHSLVLVKVCDTSTSIEKEDILVFRANRFGEDVLIMHRFSHTETNEKGELIYKTHPEGSETPDIYQTKREDIVGVYKWHIPYIGKLFLFFKSSFGFLWICQMVVIFLMKAYVSAKWEEKEKEEASIKAIFP